MRARFRDENRKGSAFGKLAGALFGFGFFFGSFFVLWTNEGRVNFGEVAQDSVVIEADAPGSVDPEQLVAAVGDLRSDELLSDPKFIKVGSYVQLNRTVEMYAWEEDERTEDEETYYEYTAVWTEYPENSDSFYDTYYYNPPMPFQSQSFTVSNATVGQLSFDPRSIEYPEGEPVALSKQMLVPEIASNRDIAIYGDYIYVGFSTMSNPEIGDLRVSYTAVVPSQNVTVFGRVSGDKLVPYTVKDDEILYRLFLTDPESATVQMEEEYQLSK